MTEPKYSQGIQWIDKEGNRKRIEASGESGSDACEKAVIEAFSQGWRPCIPQINEDTINALRQIGYFAHDRFILKIKPEHKDYHIITEMADNALSNVVLGDYTKS